MLIIKYDNPKKYAGVVWFITTRSKKAFPSDCFKFFEDDRLNHGYFDIIGWYNIPQDLLRKGKAVSDIPNNLKWHILDCIFNNDLESRILRILLKIEG